MKSVARLVVKFACILGFLGLPACAWRAPLPPAQSAAAARRELAERIRATSRPAVLFVGNSYSFGVPKAFTRTATERGKPVRTGHATYGGWSLARHAANEATLRKIREGRWDIVVLQEYSLVPAMDRRLREATMGPPLRDLVTRIRAAGALPVLYQTWGRRDGDTSRKGDDFHAMTRRVRQGYAAAARDAGGLVVVPAGDAWEKECEEGRGAALFMDDGSHPSAGGDLVTARTFVETFFGK